MKKILLLLLFALVISDSFAQRRRTTSRSNAKTQSKENFTDKLTYELRMGNLGFGNPLSISLKPGVGYKLNSIFSAGLNSKLYYDYENNIGTSDNSFFSYGANVFARGKITQNIFLSGEYGFTRFETRSGFEEFYFPTIGAGYLSGSGGKWSYGAEIFLPLNSSVRDINVSVVEYWIGFYFNL